MSGARHVMILASAGSGKTYALTNRFVRLLAEGAKPERIVALTFTHKAAGEFFDGILTKLAQAAADSDKAAVLARDIGHAGLGRADFLRMLREVTDAMPRLRLGTLDSFFARIARAFPFELGLAGEFEILQEHTARLERRRVLARMFAHAGEVSESQKDFIESFKRATFGREEKRLGLQLDAFLNEHQEVYLAAPQAALWGAPEKIWPRGNPWLGRKPDVPLAVRALRAWLAEAAPGEKQRARWEEFLAAIEVWAPGVTPSGKLTYVLNKVLAAWNELGAGRAALEFDRKKQELDASACAALLELARHVVGGELVRRLETTRGIHAVLSGYEAFYHDAVRRAGKLTFGDVQRLLEPGDGAPALTRESEMAGRLFIDYRLDAEIDHWLLDEFQDTSFGQWSVLKNLIDETVQDGEGKRSFFCVGDVKQAIFTWRGGDPRLFREIFNHYNAAAPAAIAAEHLVASWRSGPALIEMVNAVFGDAAVLTALFPGAMSVAWNREWLPHESAVKERHGQAGWLHAEDEAGRWAVMLQVLREIRPLERGLTCAVLVQKNSTAEQLADYLRREGGLPAVAESDLHVCTDNPFGAAMLALVQAAAHPGDTLALEHLGMTPLGALLAEAELQAPEDLTGVLLRQIHAGGFEHAMEYWWRKLETRLKPGDAFTRERARQFVAAARMFDETGSRDTAEFVAFMERYTVRSPEIAAVVRVMTIHKSKGLGFDVVFLPDLEGTKLDQPREGLAVHRAADRSVEWVLDVPNQFFWQNDEVLASHMGDAASEAGYEALSLLYVALTRAKRAMYVITKPVGDSASRNYPRLLTETLGDATGGVRVGSLSLAGGWAAGDADWHVAIQSPEKHDIGANEVTAIEGIGSGSVRRMARRASGEQRGEVNAGRLFSLEARSGADFGAAVHTLLAQVEWAPVVPPAWQTSGAGEEAVAEARTCLNSGALAQVWARPSGAAAVELWRERAFEMVLDGAWVTGVFDRVIVERDTAGRASRVTVFDFKTDRVAVGEMLAHAASRHVEQMKIYHQAAARLAACPLEHVICRLVFTAQCKVMDVSARI